MKEITLDECINPALRMKIKKLVELNLDPDSIWDLLDPNLRTYEDYMYAEVEKYVKYVLWLRESGRSLDNAYEKYKNYTQNYNRNFKRDLATRLELEQKRRDQERIDELSALMRYSRTQKKTLEASAKDLEKPEVLSSDVKVDLRVEPIVNSSFLETQNSQVSETKNETYNEKDEEDTESDLDFIDLAEKEKTETSVTLTANDLLFETMTNISTQANDVTFGSPISSQTLEEINQVNLEQEVAEANNKTNEALVFYDKLEDKYGVNTQNDEGLVSTYELGAKVTYQNQQYSVVKIETLPDFFNKPEIVFTLKNLKTETIIHLNRKQLEAKK